MDDTIDAGTDTAPSGRFLLRIDPALHATLREAARASSLSLNAYCARKLAAPGLGVAGPAVDAVGRAAEIVGEDLLGVVAFGSWARAEMTSLSDIDLLMVLEPDVPVSRELYRAWDERPLDWHGHAVEPHFVNLIDPGARLSSVWAEVATEGIVLFERDFAVSRRLVWIRRQIAEGRIVRRRTHGHPYWVEAA
jgi:predicted nucleotidyltransferase